MSDTGHRGFRDAEDFVEKQVTQRACPFCGHDDWSRLEDLSGAVGETSQSAVGTSEKNDPVPFLTTIPAVALNCINCGFIRFHTHPF